MNTEPAEIELDDYVCEAYLISAGLTPDEVAAIVENFRRILVEEQAGQVNSDIEKAMSTEM